MDELFGDDIVDAHSHYFATSVADFLWGGIFYQLFGSRGSDTVQRVDWLADVATAGIKRFVLSAQVDDQYEDDMTYPGDWLLGSVFDEEYLLDNAAAFAAFVYPDLIYPLLRGFRIGDPDGVTYVEGQLAAGGWYGLGELFFHGHGGDIDDSTQEIQVALFEIAAKHGVPVLVHWDMLEVEDEKSQPAQENYEQLVALLDASNPDVNVIIAHAGVGPYDPTTTDDTLAETWYNDYFTKLLERDNVFFDLGGMQLGYKEPYDYTVVQQLFLMETEKLTQVGEYLKAEIEAHPDRFLIGTDVETRSQTDFPDSDGVTGHHGTDTYKDSIEYYRTFLGMCSLSSLDAASVRIWNAEDLYALP